MNGRVYDPVLGRFLSADPFVGDAGDSQDYNRYSYLTNNPLGGTDPSGYFSLKDAVKIVAIVVVAYFTAGAALYLSGGITGVAAGATATFGNALSALAGVGGFGTTLGGAIAAGAGAGFASGFAGSLLNGGSIGDAFKAGIIGGAIGAVAGGLTYGIGGSNMNYFERAAAHGVVGGAAESAGGGQFRHGFYAGFATAAASPGISMVPKQVRFIAAAIVGGTAAVVGGGKFANGAVTGAFQYLLNDSQHEAAPAEPEPSVTVSLKGHQLESLDDYGHAYVEIRDNITGDVWISRAGPSANYPGGLFAVMQDKGYTGITVQADVAVAYKQSSEYQQIEVKHRALLLNKELVTLNRPITDVLKEFNNYAKAVTDTKTLYRPRSTNSNAYAFGAAQKVTGVTVPAMKQFPGSGTRLIKP